VSMSMNMTNYLPIHTESRDLQGVFWWWWCGLSVFVPVPPSNLAGVESLEAKVMAGDRQGAQILREPAEGDSTVSIGRGPIYICQPDPARTGQTSVNRNARRETDRRLSAPIPIALPDQSLAANINGHQPLPY